MPHQPSETFACEVGGSNIPMPKRNLQSRFDENVSPDAQPVGTRQLSFRMSLPLGLTAICIGGLDARATYCPEREPETVLRDLGRAERERCEAAKRRSAR